MRIIVVSDTHGREYRLRDILEAQPEASALICLGDGVEKVEDIMRRYPEVKLFAVRGNCDFTSDKRDFDIIKLGGKELLIAHGHTYGVKYGLESFIANAKNLGVDMALYGHTHIAHKEYLDGLHILNPGSVGKGDPRCSYATIDIVNGQIFSNIIKI